jgi:hypothetical protein
MLEPDAGHLVELLRRAAASPDERRARGQAGRHAAERFSWDRVGQRYSDRVRSLAARPASVTLAHMEAAEFEEDVAVRVLATPAWRGRDSLAELLDRWAVLTAPGASACLYLLADPASAGSAAELERHVLEAAARADVDLDACADVNVLQTPLSADSAERLHAATDIYVPLHAGAAGHIRLARRYGSVVLTPAQLEFDRPRATTAASAS